MSKPTKLSRSTLSRQSRDSIVEDASSHPATQTFSQLRKNQMQKLSLVVVGKRTQLPQSHVLVPASLIELPANTWQNMCDYLKTLG